jgi:thiaminase/transcriptional activator TenA
VYALSISETLRSMFWELWVKDLDHPFVVELYSGTLPLEKFKYYVLQDYNYLVTMVRVLSLLAAKAPTLELSRLALELAYGTVTGEMENYERLLSALDMTIDDAIRAKPNPANVAYMNFLLSTAYHGDFYVGLASVLPCFWTYEDIAERHRWRLEANRVELYKRWASVYLSNEYKTLVRKLRNAIDKSGRAASELSYYFEQALKYEIMFWQSAYTMEEWPF